MVSSYLASNIQYLRKQRGISQAVLADQLDMTRSKIASYENGNAEPSALKLLALARFFHVGINQLIEADLRLLAGRQEGDAAINLQAELPSKEENHTRMIETFEQKAAKLRKIAEGFRAYYELEWSTPGKSVSDVAPLLKNYENVLLTLDCFVRSNEEVIGYLKEIQVKITAQ